VKKIYTTVIHCALIEGLDSCKVKGRIDQAYEYLPLEKYKYRKASIQPGTEVELLAFPEGKKVMKIAFTITSLLLLIRSMEILFGY
jgi:hypothetical protein